MIFRKKINAIINSYILLDSRVSTALDLDIEIEKIYNK